MNPFWILEGFFLFTLLVSIWNLKSPKWKRIWKTPDYDICEIGKGRWVIKRETLFWGFLAISRTEYKTSDEAWEYMKETGLNEKARNVGIEPNYH